MNIETRVERIERFLSLAPARTAEPTAPIGAVAKVFAIRVIVDNVCAAMDLSKADVLSSSRRAELFRARAAIAWLARRNLDRSWSQIATALNVENHTSAMNQARRAEEMLAIDLEFHAVVDAISRRLFDRPVA